MICLLFENLLSKLVEEVESGYLHIEFLSNAITDISSCCFEFAKTNVVGTHKHDY